MEMRPLSSSGSFACSLLLLSFRAGGRSDLGIFLDLSVFRCWRFCFGVVEILAISLR